MKKSLWLVALCLLVSTSVAQRMGLKGGATISKWKTELSQTRLDFDPTTATGVGFLLVTDYKVWGGLSLQLEPGFTTRSIVSSLPLPDFNLGPTGTVEYKQELANIECPVLLKYTFFNEKTLKPYVFAGPNVAVNVSATASTTIKADSATANGGVPPIDVKPNTSSIFYSADVGAGLEIDLGPLAFVIDGRYSINLNDALSPTAAWTNAQQNFTKDLSKARLEDVRIFAGIMLDL